MQTTLYSVWRASREAAVVTMPDWIDHANCGQVRAVLTGAVASGLPVVIADLTRTGFCGGPAAETLVSAHVQAAEAGAQLRVVAAALKARLIGRIAGADHPLDFYPDLAAALAGPGMYGTVGVRPAAGHTVRLRLVLGGAAPSRPGKTVRRLSVVPPPGQVPPPGPSPAPA